MPERNGRGATTRGDLVDRLRRPRREGLGALQKGCTHGGHRLKEASVLAWPLVVIHVAMRSGHWAEGLGALRRRLQLGMWQIGWRWWAGAGLYSYRLL